MINASELDRRVTIQRFVVVADAFNQEKEVWSDFLSVWARKRDVSDQERFEYGKIGAVNIARFVIRSTTLSRTVTASFRLFHEGKSWEISGIKETGDGRNRFLEMTAIRNSD